MLTYRVLKHVMTKTRKNVLP